MKVFLCIIGMMLTNISVAKKMNARSWAFYKMNIELQENAMERRNILEKYKKQFEFFDERDSKLKEWDQIKHK